MGEFNHRKAPMTQTKLMNTWIRIGFGSLLIATLTAGAVMRYLKRRKLVAIPNRLCSY